MRAAPLPSARRVVVCGILWGSPMGRSNFWIGVPPPLRRRDGAGVHRPPVTSPAPMLRNQSHANTEAAAGGPDLRVASQLRGQTGGRRVMGTRKPYRIADSDMPIIVGDSQGKRDRLRRHKQTGSKPDPGGTAAVGTGRSPTLSL